MNLTKEEKQYVRGLIFRNDSLRKQLRSNSIQKSYFNMTDEQIRKSHKNYVRSHLYGMRSWIRQQEAKL